jgi:hypothetical protein
VARDKLGLGPHNRLNTPVRAWGPGEVCSLSTSPGHLISAYAGSSLTQERGLRFGKGGRVVTAREQVAVGIQGDAD